MELLDFISNEFLRVKVEKKGAGSYAGSPLESAMSVLIGIGVTNVTEQDHLNVILAGAGNGSLPVGASGQPLSLERLLNKIKHRKPQIANFRLEYGRHIFVICPDRTEGGAEGIYEFDVDAFCQSCRSAADVL